MCPLHACPSLGLTLTDEVVREKPTEQTGRNRHQPGHHVEDPALQGGAWPQRRPVALRHREEGAGSLAAPGRCRPGELCSPQPGPRAEDLRRHVPPAGPRAAPWKCQALSALPVQLGPQAAYHPAPTLGVGSPGHPGHQNQEGGQRPQWRSQGRWGPGTLPPSSVFPPEWHQQTDTRAGLALRVGPAEQRVKVMGRESCHRDQHSGSQNQLLPLHGQSRPCLEPRGCPPTQSPGAHRVFGASETGQAWAASALFAPCVSPGR